MGDVIQDKRCACSFVNPFCFVPNKVVDIDYSDSIVRRFKTVEVDSATHRTHPVYEDIDLQQEIDAQRVNSGFEYMRHLLKTGQAVPGDFVDDGTHGVDTSLYPSDPHEALKLANEQAARIASFASALGLDENESLTADNLEKMLKRKVAELYQEQVNAAKTTGGDE